MKLHSKSHVNIGQVTKHINIYLSHYLFLHYYYFIHYKAYTNELQIIIEGLKQHLLSLKLQPWTINEFFYFIGILAKFYGTNVIIVYEIEF